MPMVRKEKPRRLLECWLDKKHVSPAMEKLQNDAVFFWRYGLVLSDPAVVAGSGSSPGGRKNVCLWRSAPDDAACCQGAGISGGHLMRCEGREHPVGICQRETDLEEERRLFFVGLTRAQEELVLTTSGKPSVFLSNLPATQINREAVAAQQVRNEQLSLFCRSVFWPV